MKKYLISIIFFFIILFFFLRLSLPPQNKVNLNPIKTEIKEEKELINSKVQALFYLYPDFAYLLKEANLKIPIYENMIPQGITFINNHFLITAYDSQNKVNSQVYLVNKDGDVINTVTLNTKSHVGSIFYDKINQLIWLPGLNNLEAYNPEDFFTKTTAVPKYIYNNVNNDLLDYQNKNLNTISYLTIYHNDLYVGSFGYLEKGLVKKYHITKNGNYLSLVYNAEFSVPSKVQSLAFYEKDNQTYLFLTRSYGRNNPSYLEIYHFTNQLQEKIISYKLPSMLEQITLENNNIYAIFESNASKYIESKAKIEDICIFDLTKITLK